jgi:hypothetical protein
MVVVVVHGQLKESRVMAARVGQYLAEEAPDTSLSGPTKSLASTTEDGFKYLMKSASFRIVSSTFRSITCAINEIQRCGDMTGEWF